MNVDGNISLSLESQRERMFLNKSLKFENKLRSAGEVPESVIQILLHKL